MIHNCTSRVKVINNVSCKTRSNIFQFEQFLHNLPPKKHSKQCCVDQKSKWLYEKNITTVFNTYKRSGPAFYYLASQTCLPFPRQTPYETLGLRARTIVNLLFKLTTVILLFAFVTLGLTINTSERPMVCIYFNDAQLIVQRQSKL